MAFREVLKRLSKAKSTILNDIWIEIVTFTLVALIVTAVTKLTSTNLTFDNQLMTVLGTALGFVISFRTSTAYERFTEGRLLWTTMAITSRTLAQIIWIQVPDRRKPKPEPADLTEGIPGRQIPELEVVVEKKSMINLVQAYSVAVKHTLRGEGGVYYKDLYPLIAFLPRFARHEDQATEDDILPLWQSSKMDYSMYRTMPADTFTSIDPVRRSSTDPTLEKKVYLNEEIRETLSLPDDEKMFDVESQLLPQVPCEQRLLPAKNTPPGFFRHYVVPFFRWLRNPFVHIRHHRKHKLESKRNLLGKKRQRQTDSNVPMEIVMFLLSYHGWLVEEKFIPDSAAGNMYGNICVLQNTVVHLERIKNTPLPFAYQAHLRISLWMYLFFLPSQLYGAFHWLTIPATTISAFILLGFLEIGQEIENPFNYDDDDLDLDAFCYAIQRDLHEVTAHTSPHPSSYIFSKWNMPFSPEDPRNAQEIVSDPTHPYHQSGEGGAHTIRKTMLKCWKQVDTVTRSM